jgi:putative hydrolase of the HAD superfamily
MIRGVTFDWWNTVAATTKDQDLRLRDLRIQRLLEALNGLGDSRPPVTEKSLFEAYDRQTAFLEEGWARNVDLHPDEQVRAFLEFAGLDGNDASLAPVVAEAFGGALLELPPTLFPHIAETLEWLKRERYAVGLVSNTGRTWGRYLRTVQDRLGIGRYFDVRIFSDEAGVRKPEPKIFQIALEALRLPPAEVFHVGDDVTADVGGAKAAGMQAVWFDTGKWPDAESVEADAEIHDHAELPGVLRWWRR